METIDCNKNMKHAKSNVEKIMGIFLLTAVFFKTGAMPTPTKSQNPTNCG